MNLTLEVIISIFILLIFSLPIFYQKAVYEEEKMKIFEKYYNKIEDLGLRDCLIEKNCNLDWIKSYNNCLPDKKFVLPKDDYLTFWLFGKEEKYCPTLVVIDLSKAPKD
ncbi:MAG TPA: hypothetical protein EYH54_01370 [Nautiliaceae bacterium]|nr:hypothetical protein [Nautiliaceae bacterium]